MDKNEYRAKLEEINNLVDRQDYKGALKIVDTIDWRRVRSARTLCMVGEIYEANKRYADSRRLLLLAHQRAPIGKTVLYRLVELSIKMGNFDEAVEYYKRFVEVSPNDNSRYILKYKIYRAKRSPIEEQISILQEYKSKEYTERWAFELARLYAKAGMKAACIEECDDLILWFSEGRYVTKAMELKMKFTPLTPAQQEKYRGSQGRRPVQNLAGTMANAAADIPKAASATSVDQEIEEILKNVSLGNTTEVSEKSTVQTAETQAPEELPVYRPNLESSEDLQDKVAQGLRDVFQGKSAEAANEAAATREPSEDMKKDTKNYVVKDLEPEVFGKPSEFKPFHVGETMTMEVKAEAPKAKMIKAEDLKPEAFKTDTTSVELDLDALLAETANEFAQAVAEVESAAEGEAAAEEMTEAPGEAKEEVTEQTVVESQETECTQDLTTAARAAMVAESLSAAFDEKAEELEALMHAEGGETEEVELPAEQEEQPVEEVEEINISEKEVSTDGATKVIPVDEVRAAVEEVDFAKALEQELAETVIPEEAPSPAAQDTIAFKEEPQKAMPLNSAVEGLMRHHLTEEEHRRLFTYFAPIPGMIQQINEALDIAQESACAKTSKSGNIIVTGREGSGKTRLSEGLIKALCKERQMEGAKVAYLDAAKLNEKDPVTVVGKMAGGFLVVEHAGELKADIVENMSKAMEFKTNRLTVILEDLKPGIRSLEEKYPEFMEKFDSRIVIPVFTNDELVSFAKTYAKEQGYKIDDMAVLALYTLIGDNQNEENPVAIGMVREMLDEAIKKASRKGRRTGKKVSRRHLDESGRIMLYEKDFDI